MLPSADFSSLLGLWWWLRRWGLNDAQLLLQSDTEFANDEVFLALLELSLPLPKHVLVGLLSHGDALELFLARPQLALTLPDLAEHLLDLALPVLLHHPESVVRCGGERRALDLEQPFDDLREREPHVRVRVPAAMDELGQDMWA
jgi:hypothetical protein